MRASRAAACDERPRLLRSTREGGVLFGAGGISTVKKSLQHSCGCAPVRGFHSRALTVCDSSIRQVIFLLLRPGDRRCDSSRPEYSYHGRGFRGLSEAFGAPPRHSRPARKQPRRSGVRSESDQPSRRDDVVYGERCERRCCRECKKRSPWRVGFLPTRVSGRRRDDPRDAARPRRVARRPRRSSRTRRRQRRRPGCVQQGHAGVFQDALRVPPRVGTVCVPRPCDSNLGPPSPRASAFPSLARARLPERPRRASPNRAASARAPAPPRGPSPATPPRLT